MTPKETVQAIYAAFQRGDIPFILDQLAPDVFWRNPPVGAFFTKLNVVVEMTGLRTI